MEGDQLRISPPPRHSQALREQLAVSGYLSPNPPRLSTASRPAFTNVSTLQATDMRQPPTQAVTKYIQSTGSPKPWSRLTLHHFTTQYPSLEPITQTPQNSLTATTTTIAATIAHEADMTPTALTGLMTEIIIHPITAVLALDILTPRRCIKCPPNRHYALVV